MKFKTHRGAAKRFRRTAKGKIKRSHAFARHILTKKTRQRKRRLRRSTLVSNKAEAATVARMLGR